MKPESFKPSPESDIEERALLKRYLSMIEFYSDRFRELKELQRKNPGGLTDPEVKSQMNFIDQERHQIHLELFEIGAKLGKDKNDIMSDILRSEGGSLEEYGLPEFFIKTADDEFNYDAELNKEIFKQDEICLIFAITSIDAMTDEMVPPEDYEERKKRAETLAKEIGGKLAEGKEGEYHGTIFLLGVVFPKRDLEKVAAIIRNNPKKFRLGKEFYE